MGEYATKENRAKESMRKKNALTGSASGNFGGSSGVRRTHMERSRRRAARRKTVFMEKAALCAAAALAAGMVLGVCLFGTIRTEAASSTVSEKYYTSVKVQSGDTLWSIASDYITDEYADMNEYIDEVCAMNGISCDEIHSGQYITVPYYRTVSAER